MADSFKMSKSLYSELMVNEVKLKENTSATSTADSGSDEAWSFLTLSWFPAPWVSLSMEQ